MKSVQIPYDLFIDLAMYHLRGEDDFEEEIRQGLEKKLDAMLNRQLYSQYKTAPTEEQREQARQEYLDRRGVPQSYRASFLISDTASADRQSLLEDFLNLDMAFLNSL